MKIELEKQEHNVVKFNIEIPAKDAVEAYNRISQPTVDSYDFNVGEDLKLTATVEVRPEFDLKEYKGLTVDVEEYVIPEDAYQKSLDNMLDKDYEVIYLDLSEEEAIERILGRLTCSCGKSYNLNVDNLKPKVEGICDGCGKELVKRNDLLNIKYE